MKTLVQTLTWCPEEAPERVKVIEYHLKCMLGYQGEWDLLITNNGGPINDLLDEYENKIGKDRTVIRQDNERNIGWPVGKNQGVKYAMENGYDLLINMDCDVYVEDKKWIERCQQASKVLPAFMVRVHMLEGLIKTTLVNGERWDIYPEWMGGCNVMTRKALETVGGYNNVFVPALWGFHDCEYGRRLLKAGFFKDFPERTYPSLSRTYCRTCNVPHRDQLVTDDQYEAYLQPEKHRIAGTLGHLFAMEEHAVMTGTHPVFFDWNTEPVV